MDQLINSSISAKGSERGSSSPAIAPQFLKHLIIVSSLTLRHASLIMRIAVKISTDLAMSKADKLADESIFPNVCLIKSALY